jgi:small subunit ribosomal protein S6
LREYETTFIVQPEISDEGSQAILSKLDGILTTGGATRLMCEDHGKRKLAYEVRKFHKGHYYTLMFLDEGAVVPDLERTLRLEESVLRFLTILADDEVADVDARKAEATEAEEAQTQRAEERAVREAEEAVARRVAEEAEREASLAAAAEAATVATAAEAAASESAESASADETPAEAATTESEAAKPAEKPADTPEPTTEKTPEAPPAPEAKADDATAAESGEEKS